MEITWELLIRVWHNYPSRLDTGSYFEISLQVSVQYFASYLNYLSLKSLRCWEAPYHTSCAGNLKRNQAFLISINCRKINFKIIIETASLIFFDNMKDFTWHKKSLGTNIFILSFYATGISFFSHFIIFNLAISIFFSSFIRKISKRHHFQHL